MQLKKYFYVIFEINYILFKISYNWKFLAAYGLADFVEELNLTSVATITGDCNEMNFEDIMIVCDCSYDNSTCHVTYMYVSQIFICFSRCISSDIFFE